MLTNVHLGVLVFPRVIGLTAFTCTVCTATKKNEKKKKRIQDSSPTRQLTDTVFETIHRQILRQLTNTL